MSPEDLLPAADAVKVDSRREPIRHPEKLREKGELTGRGEVVVRVHRPEKGTYPRILVVLENELEGLVGKSIPPGAKTVKERITPSVGRRHCPPLAAEIDANDLNTVVTGREINRLE
jgi:hypothetical protein